MYESIYDSIEAAKSEAFRYKKRASRLRKTVVTLRTQLAEAKGEIEKYIGLKTRLQWILNECNSDNSEGNKINRIRKAVGQALEPTQNQAGDHI